VKENDRYETEKSGHDSKKRKKIRHNNKNENKGNDKDKDRHKDKQRTVFEFFSPRLSKSREFIKIGTLLENPL
jgi:hypothetical protein